MAENTNRDYSRPTETYSSQQSSKTQTYSSATDPQKTQIYETSEQLVSRAHQLGIGDVLMLNGNAYTITGIISQETGEAVIYNIHNLHQQPFALKLYLEFRDAKDEPNPEALQRIKSIIEPVILRLHDFGTGTSKYQHKYCFEICDFAAGGTLLTRDDYSQNFIRHTIIPQIVKGIQTLHRHKIFHCDLKPENIFWLDVECTHLVVGDYGSAKTFEETSQNVLKYTSTTKGTNFYLAPEQPRGIVSEKNDYYSFGMILLHLLYPHVVNREYLHKIVERQFERKPIIDFDQKYGHLNDLIAGLTLADVSSRWGEKEVIQWLRGENIPVVYAIDPNIQPIKLGKATIRMPQQLAEYIEDCDDWFDNLIEDAEGYGIFLRWLADIQDLERKKIFDRMIKHYRQDGKPFVKEAILRYFFPNRPVQIDMQTYDFWNTSELDEMVNQCLLQLDDMSAITPLATMKFYLFELEFSLRQVFIAIDGQAKLILANTLNRIEELLNILPKANFDDCLCQWYAKISKKSFPPIILCTLTTTDQFFRYLEVQSNWYDKLFVDNEVYDIFLRWLIGVQGEKRKKIFENMVKHYRQDGKEFVKDAILRYFSYGYPVQVDTISYNLWDTSDLQTIVNDLFYHLDNISRTTSIESLKFYLFQLEFALREVETMKSVGQSKLIAKKVLDKIEGVLNLSPKKSFDDYICYFYRNIPNGVVLPVLFYTFGQKCSLQAIWSNFNQDIDTQLKALGFSGNMTSVYEYLFNLAKDCVAKGDVITCLPLLRQFISRMPEFFVRIQNEKTFNTNGEIKKFLDAIYSPAFKKAQTAFKNAEYEVQEAQKILSSCQKAASKVERRWEYESIYTSFGKAKSSLLIAQNKFDSKDYKALLEIPVIIQNVLKIVNNAVSNAKTLQTKCEREHDEILIKKITTGLAWTMAVTIGVVVCGIIFVNWNAIAQTVSYFIHDCVAAVGMLFQQFLVFVGNVLKGIGMILLIIFFIAVLFNSK